MYDVPITSPAETFIWAVVLILSLVVSITVLDVFKENKNEKKEVNRKKLL